MISLQQYLIEQYEYSDSIQEGKIWDAIKDWFKDLFKPSENIEFDRYNFYNDDNENAIQNLEDYKIYIKNNFNKKYCQVKLIESKYLENIIEPNGHKPDEESKTGFYKFIDDDKKGIYYAIFYLEKNKVKDIPCLLKVNKNNDNLEIINIQVIDEFVNVLSLKIVFDILLSSTLLKDIKQIICKETTNKNLYNQLINDCDFEKKLVDNNNIAIKEINNK